MMICVHFKDAEIWKGKLLPTIKHWTSYIRLNKLIMSFWREIGTILQSLTVLTLKCRATGNDYGFAIKAGNENNNEDLEWAN